jgi:hypothetical protein
MDIRVIDNDLDLIIYFDLFSLEILRLYELFLDQ